MLKKNRNSPKANHSPKANQFRTVTETRKIYERVQKQEERGSEDYLETTFDPGKYLDHADPLDDLSREEFWRFNQATENAAKQTAEGVERAKRRLGQVQEEDSEKNEMSNFETKRTDGKINMDPSRPEFKGQPKTSILNPSCFGGLFSRSREK